MKLFLCGGGAGEQTILANKKFGEVIDHSKPLLYVPLAMEKEKYPSCLEWITGELKDLNLVGIDMVYSAEELYSKDFNKYCAIFIGGGNTCKLLKKLKDSGSFDKIKEYINNDGIVFGGSAGAIIFGKDLDACKLDDTNEVGLTDTDGFDVLNGISLLCHYTNRTEEKDAKSREYLLSISSRRKLVALPEEDTIFIDDDSAYVIGTRPYYVFENGKVNKCEIVSIESNTLKR